MGAIFSYRGGWRIELCCIRPGNGALLSAYVSYPFLGNEFCLPVGSDGSVLLRAFVVLPKGNLGPPLKPLFTWLEPSAEPTASRIRPIMRTLIAMKKETKLSTLEMAGALFIVPKGGRVRNEIHLEQSGQAQNTSNQHQTRGPLSDFWRSSLDAIVNYWQKIKNFPSLRKAYNAHLLVAYMNAALRTSSWLDNECVSLTDWSNR